AERGLPRRRLLDPRVAVAQHDRPPAAHEVDVRATVGVPLPASFGTFEELGVAGGEDGRVEVSVHAAGDDLGGPGAGFGVGHGGSCGWAGGAPQPRRARTASRSVSPASEPSPVATREAAAVPQRAAAGTSCPCSSPVRNPAQYASPQPVVSATSVLIAGTCSAPEAVTTRLPSSPRVTSTPRGPSASSVSAASRTSSAPAISRAWLSFGST